MSQLTTSLTSALSDQHEMLNRPPNKQADQFGSMVPISYLKHAPDIRQTKVDGQLGMAKLKDLCRADLDKMRLHGLASMTLELTDHSAS